jgi:predicted ATPase/class 3 adenylate cyclase
MTTLPDGQLAFLLTDIEGSTKLWEQFPDAMKSALERHDSVLRNAIESHGGTVFKTAGDAFFAVFEATSQATAAAIAAQQALVAGDWGETGPLRVRMAIHTGEANRRGGDYFGPPMNCVARLLAAGYGGQVLITDTAREAIAVDIAVQDLGIHRLRDVQRPIQVYQLVAADLRTDFPPVKTLDYDPHNLPAEVTSFVARDHELRSLDAWLRRDTVRLVTLTGPGGVGKTRLAIQAARHAREPFPDGRYLVPLAAVTDPALVVDAIAQVFDLHQTGELPMLDLVQSALQDQQALLVLDNFEQVIAAADVVESLLAQCPRLKILVTSRVALRTYGEQEYAVAPLAVPRADQLASPRHIVQVDSVRLFVERARAVRAGFQVTEENATAIGSLCARLDGLPLAIELASARSRMLSPAAMLRRIETRLDFLQDGVRNLPARQQTLRSTIAWSYDLLSAADRACFRRSAVFVGGFGLEAAEHVIGDDGEGGIPDRLSTLISGSLLNVVDGPDGEPRFSMLETIREYGLEQLEQAGETHQYRQRHAAWCLAYGRAAHDHRHDSDPSLWLRHLETEHDNIRAALGFLEQDAAQDAMLELATALGWFCEVRGFITEGRAWLDRALVQSAGAPAALRANALNRAGTLAYFHGDLHAAEVHFQASLDIHRERGETQMYPILLNNLGNVARLQGKFDRAVDMYEQAGDALREAGDYRRQATVLFNLGSLVQEHGDYERSRSLFAESLRLRRELADVRGIASSLDGLAGLSADLGEHQAAIALYRESISRWHDLMDHERAADMWQGLAGVYLQLGEIEQADDAMEQAMAIHGKSGNAMNIAADKHTLGLIAHARHDHVLALSLLREVLPAWLEQDHVPGLIISLESLGEVIHALGDTSRGVRLIAAAQAQRDALHLPVPPSERGKQQEVLGELRTTLGDAAFTACWQDGQNLTIEQACAEACAPFDIQVPAPQPAIRSRS